MPVGYLCNYPLVPSLSLLPLAETFAALPNTNMIGSLQLLSSTGTSDSNAVGRGFDPPATPNEETWRSRQLGPLEEDIVESINSIDLS